MIQLSYAILRISDDFKLEGHNQSCIFNVPFQLPLWGRREEGRKELHKETPRRVQEVPEAPFKVLTPQNVIFHICFIYGIIHDHLLKYPSEHELF